MRADEVIAAVEPGAGRARRATDGILVVLAGTALVVLAGIADPAPGVERAVTDLVDRLPRAWVGFWRLVFALAPVWALAVGVGLLVRRRWAVARDLALAAAIAGPVAVVASRMAVGDWPAWPGSPPWPVPEGWGPPVALAVASAVILAAGPHLGQPRRRLGRWIVGAASVAAVLSGAAPPTSVLGALLTGVVAASITHLVLGSARGWPRLSEVATALDELGVEADDLRVATRQPGGVFVVEARDRLGEPLVVKVYGRDAHDTRLLAVLWRTVWYRGAGASRVIGRVRQVEHEALMTLLAGRAGVPTVDVVTAAVTERGDAVLVTRPAGVALADRPDRWDAVRARAVWSALERLHRAGIVHGRIDDERLHVDDDGQLALTDLSEAGMVSRGALLEVERAQVLVATALGLGIDAALDVAVTALTPDELGAVLPLVQMPAMTPAQRATIRSGALDLDALRSAGAARLGVDEPELRQLRRVSGGAFLRLALLVIVGVGLVSAAADLDAEAILTELGDASVALLLLGLVIGQTPRLTQAVSTLGAAPIPLPLGPTYALQLASSFIGLAVPSTAARVAMNVRFLQRHGLPPGSALTVGALDGVTSFVLQVLTLSTILVLTPLSLDLSLDLDEAGRLWRLVVVVIGLAVVAVAAVLAVGRWRGPVLAWIRSFLGDARRSVRGLSNPRRLGLLVGGSAATELLFALTLGVFAAALGYPVGVVELLVINMTVSLLAGLLPIPGGIGVAEGGLTLGLVLAGVPESAAFAAVIGYRVTTFYLPPLWGYWCLRWLERNDHL